MPGPAAGGPPPGVLRQPGGSCPLHRDSSDGLQLPRSRPGGMRRGRSSAVELAAMIRGRKVSSREVVQAHLDWVEAVNPYLNAIVRLLPDQALAATDVADRAVADGAGLGPLHGVPFTVKENIDLAGTPTTQAIRRWPRRSPRSTPRRWNGCARRRDPDRPDQPAGLGLRVHTDSALHGRSRSTWG